MIIPTANLLSWSKLLLGGLEKSMPSKYTALLPKIITTLTPKKWFALVFVQWVTSHSIWWRAICWPVLWYHNNVPEPHLCGPPFKMAQEDGLLLALLYLLSQSVPIMGILLLISAGFIALMGQDYQFLLCPSYSQFSIYLASAQEQTFEVPQWHIPQGYNYYMCWLTVPFISCVTNIWLPGKSQG